VEPDFTEMEEKEDYKPNVYVLSGSFVLVLGMLFLGMRGGLNEIPITSSKVYYSSHKFANEMCVNPAYYLVENILNSKKVETRAHFNYMDMESAKRRTESLHAFACDSTVNILKIERPNIVVILLESWSADLIESLGGEPGITPNFRELEKDGLLFTNIYASANRSQHAMSSLFGGLPGMPVTTITNHPDKYYAVPSLVKKMDSIGYHTSFYFGGELNYGNILSYLRYNEFDEIVEGKDINEGFFKGKLGYHDTDVMPWYVEQLSRYEQPFFSTLFTQSSHSPYDYPKIFEEIEWPAIEKQYVNSGYYTDIAIGMFMEKAKQQEWYDSTLFVFVADHSHATYKNHRMESFDHHKIPMLIYGEPLQDSLRGMTFDKICGNTDLPATILAQLRMKHDEFIWSKDVFGKCYKPFAFFELNNGLGWKTPEGEFVYSNTGVYIKNTLPEAVRDSVVKDGKAYMQYHFDLFNSY
jgi:phosphoglycerol transferase MdoB-like AlkP superfamily enzyme